MTTTSLPGSRGQAGDCFDVPPTVTSKRDGAHGVGEADSPRGFSGAAVDPLALLGDLLAGAVTAELRDLRARIAALAAEFDACGDSLIFAYRPARALRRLLDLASGQPGVSPPGLAATSFPKS